MLDLNGFLYLTGRTSSDPLILNSPDEGATFDPYDTTYGGGLSDAIVARVPYSGCTGAGAPGACANLGTWRATYLGGTATDLGNALESYLEGVFLFGSTTSAGTAGEPLPSPAPAGFPTINIGSGAYFDAAQQRWHRHLLLCSRWPARPPDLLDLHRW